MKKALSLLLVFVMLLGLCACGKDDTQATGGTQPSEPAASQPSEPAASQPSEPAASQPSEPTASQPSEPTASQPSEPAASQPSEPEASQPSEPAASQPSEPEATQPSEPEATQPTEPPVIQPTEPPVTCNHSWSNATCTAPKTCTKCGATEGGVAEHSWTDATCTAPKTCTKCGATEGSAEVHSWSNATCTAPKTCTKCGATEGNAAGHSYNDGNCTVCGVADPNVPFEGNEWAAYIVKAGTSEQGEILSVYTLMPTKFQGYTHKEYYANASYGSVNYGSITHNGKTYYDFWFSSNMNGITWEDNGDTVTVTFAYDYPAVKLVLSRTGEAQFTVTSSSDAANIPVGTVFARTGNDEPEDTSKCHVYSDGVCIYCQEIAENYVAFDENAYWEFITLGDDGKLYFYWIGHIDTADGEGSCMMNVCYYEANRSSKYDKKTYNGVTYGMTGGIVEYCTYEINDGMITIDLTYGNGWMTLAQTAGDQLTVVSVDGFWDQAEILQAFTIGGAFTATDKNNCVIA